MLFLKKCKAVTFFQHVNTYIYPYKYWVCCLPWVYFQAASHKPLDEQFRTKDLGPTSTTTRLFGKHIRRPYLHYYYFDKHFTELDEKNKNKCNKEYQIENWQEQSKQNETQKHLWENKILWYYEYKQHKIFKKKNSYSKFSGKKWAWKSAPFPWTVPGQGAALHQRNEALVLAIFAGGHDFKVLVQLLPSDGPCKRGIPLDNSQQQC